MAVWLLSMATTWEYTSQDFSTPPIAAGSPWGVICSSSFISFLVRHPSPAVLPDVTTSQYVRNSSDGFDTFEEVGGQIPRTKPPWSSSPFFAAVGGHNPMLANKWLTVFFFLWQPIVFTARCYASAALAVMRCPCVYLFVCPSRSWILSKRIIVSSDFFHRR